MDRIINFLKNIFQPRYIYNLQRFEPIKENEFYILKELGTHTCIKATAEDIFKSDLLYYTNPNDIIYIAKIEEHNIREKQKFKIIEENRDLSFTIQNAYFRKQFTAREILEDQSISEQIDPISLVKIAYSAGLRDGRKISNDIARKEKINSSKNTELKVVK